MGKITGTAPPAHRLPALALDTICFLYIIILLWLWPSAAHPVGGGHTHLYYFLIKTIHMFLSPWAEPMAAAQMCGEESRSIQKLCKPLVCSPRQFAVADENLDPKFSSEFHITAPAPAPPSSWPGRRPPRRWSRPSRTGRPGTRRCRSSWR